MPAEAAVVPAAAADASSKAAFRRRLCRAILGLHEAFLSSDDESSGSLCQVWLPELVGENEPPVLRTKGTPFCVAGTGDLLALFRCISCRYCFGTDINAPDNLGAPGRVFTSCEPEMSRNVQKYSREIYARASEAMHCRVHATMMLPLFTEKNSTRVVGVLEVVQTVEDMPFAQLAATLSAVLQRSQLYTCDTTADQKEMEFSLAAAKSFAALRVSSNPSSPISSAGELPVIRGSHATANSAAAAAPKVDATFAAQAQSHIIEDIGQAAAAAVMKSRPPQQQQAADMESPSNSAAAAANDSAGAAASQEAAADERSTAKSCAHATVAAAVPVDEEALVTRLRAASAPEVRRGKRPAGVPATIADLLRDSQGDATAVGGRSLKRRSPPGRTPRGVSGVDQDADDEDGEDIGEDSGSEEDEPEEQPPPGSRRRRGKGSGNAGKPGKKLRLEQLQSQFGVGLKEAAKSLGICATTLKRACRRHGIQRWPRRQLVKLSKTLDNMESPAALTAHDGTAMAGPAGGGPGAGARDDRWLTLAQLIPTMRAASGTVPVPQIEEAGQPEQQQQQQQALPPAGSDSLPQALLPKSLGLATGRDTTMESVDVPLPPDHSWAQPKSLQQQQQLPASTIPPLIAPQMQNGISFSGADGYPLASLQLAQHTILQSLPPLPDDPPDNFMAQGLPHSPLALLHNGSPSGGHAHMALSSPFVLQQSSQQPQHLREDLQLQHMVTVPGFHSQLRECDGSSHGPSPPGLGGYSRLLQLPPEPTQPVSAAQQQQAQAQAQLAGQQQQQQQPLNNIQQAQQQTSGSQQHSGLQHGGYGNGMQAAAEDGFDGHAVGDMDFDDDDVGLIDAEVFEMLLNE